MLSEADTDDKYVPVGKIVRAHGLKGQIKVISYSGSADDLLSYKDIYLCHERDKKPYKIKSCRSQGKFAVYQLSNVSDRNTAESLTGMNVLVLKDSMPTLADE